MIGFVGFVLLVVVGVHLYLWKRLVRDTLRPGRWRKAGGITVLLLAILVPTTLVLTRSGYVEWLAWPGYLWLALMFYLLVILVALEIPRLVIGLVWRAKRPNSAARGRAGQATATDSARAGAATADDGNAAASPARGGIRTSIIEADEPGPHDRSPGTIDGAPTGRNPLSDGAAGLNHVSDAAGHNPISGAAGHNPVGGAAGRNPFGGGAAGRNPIGGGAAGRNLLSDGAAGRNPLSDGAAGGDSAARGTSDSDGRDNGPGSGDGDDPDRKTGIERRLLLARGAAIFAGLTAAGITGYGVRTALGGPQLDRVRIPIAKLPRAMDGTRLAVVSDIHLGPLTGPDHMRRIVSMINSTDADVVCIVGDMVDGSVEELGTAATALRDVRARQGAYFVTGNHEYYSGFEQWVEEVARLGVRPLRNERLEVATRGGVFDLAGVNDVGGAQFGDGPDFERALGDRDTTRPVVLMAHQPIVAHDAARYGVDLQVSGHTHGGHMVPFNYLVGLEQPVVSGYGEVDGVPVYVTNGAGFWGPPVRVGAPPQVTLIELRTP